MDRKKALVAMMACLAWTVAACDDDEGESATPAINEETSELAADMFVGTIDESFSNFEPVVAGGMMFQPEHDGEDCYTESGDASDTDADQIPTDWTITYDCSYSEEGFTYSMNGFQHVQDDDPQAAAFAFTMDADMELAFSGEGADLSASWVGSLVASEPDGAFSVDADMTAVGDMVGEDGEVHYSQDMDMVTVYDPDGAWAMGDELIAGTYTVDGSWAVDFRSPEESGAAAFTVDTVVPMTVDPLCFSLITAGEVDLSFVHQGRTRNVKVTWTGCDTYTATFSESAAGS